MSEKLLLSLAADIIKRFRSGENVYDEEMDSLLRAYRAHLELQELKSHIRSAEAHLRSSMERLQSEEKVWSIKKIRA